MIGGESDFVRSVVNVSSFLHNSLYITFTQLTDHPVMHTHPDQSQQLRHLLFTTSVRVSHYA